MIAELEHEREALLAEYEANRRRTRWIFDLLVPQAYYDRPIPLRHPFVFYDGHIPGFSFLTLVRRALAGCAIDPTLEKLFERGIDPASLAQADEKTPQSWPSRDTVQAFSDACDERVRTALRETSPQESSYTIIEHEQMHHETLLYIVHQLSHDRKRPVPVEHWDCVPPAYRRAEILAGEATLGARKNDVPFGWDNEFEETRVAVDGFEIEIDNVTNARYLEFVNAGGEVPPFWRRNGNEWELATLFDDVPLPRAWPVYVTQHQAAAYAQWKGMRLPTEAEYHRAAYGTPSGEERVQPWGDDAPEAGVHGNFGFAYLDPVPVGSFAAGASAWGVNDLVGNGWEWTSTAFAPLPGFAPMRSYPQYSADFFDGEHFVMKGAAPVTHARTIRRSFRNWFRPDYPYVYATFRCVT